MNKVLGTVVSSALVAVGVVALRRFGPGLAERGMNKCHELMGHMSEGCPPGQTVQGQEEVGAGREVGHEREGQPAPSSVTT